jgi:hypothetical protein
VRWRREVAGHRLDTNQLRGRRRIDQVW